MQLYAFTKKKKARKTVKIEQVKTTVNTIKYYNIFTIPLFSTVTDPNPIFYYLILTYNLHLNSCEYIVITTKCHDNFSCARTQYDILLFYFNP